MPPDGAAGNGARFALSRRLARGRISLLRAKLPEYAEAAIARYLELLSAARAAGADLSGSATPRFDATDRSGVINRYLAGDTSEFLTLAIEADLRRMYDQPRVQRAFNPLRPKAPKRTGAARIRAALLKLVGKAPPRPPLPPRPPQPTKQDLFPRVDANARARAFATGLVAFLGRELERGPDVAEIIAWLRAARINASDPTREAALATSLFRDHPRRALVLLDAVSTGHDLGELTVPLLIEGAGYLRSRGYHHRVLAVCTLFLERQRASRTLPAVMLEHGWHAAIHLGRIDQALDFADRWLTVDRRTGQPLAAKALALATFDRSGAIALLHDAGTARDDGAGDMGRVLADLLSREGLHDEAETALRRVTPAAFGAASPEPLFVLQNIYTRRGIDADFVSPVFAVQGSDLAWSRRITVDGLVDSTPRSATSNPALVSVVMPAFNAATVIDTAIAGVLAQWHEILELIVVDDASTDATRDHVRRWMARDPRVTMLEHATNLGPFASRNRGIDAATGRYVAFCDADDLWLRAHLSDHVAALTKGRLLSLSRWIRVTEDGLVQPDPVGRFVEVCPQSLLVARRLFAQVGRFDPVRFGAEREFIDRVLVSAGPEAVVTLDKILTIGRLHDAAQSTRGAARSLPVIGSPTRQRYARAWNEWHLDLSRAGRLTPAFARPGRRPFPAPAEMLGDA